MTDAPRADHGAKQNAYDERRSGDGSRLARPLRALLAISLGTLAIGALIDGAAVGAPAPQPAAGAITAAVRSPGPMVVAPIAAHHVTRAKIGLFTASPAQLPASGGSVRLVAVVQGATSCSFVSNATVKHLPATMPCASGSVSVSVRLPRNTGSLPRNFHFRLKASGPTSSITAGPVSVTERPTVAAHSAPKVTAQPTARTISAGGIASFSAAASGSPTPTVRWQVSTNTGKSWSLIAAVTAGSYSFKATASENGNEYRAVFTNSQGVARSAAAKLTVTAASQLPPASGGSLPALATAPTVTSQPANAAVTSGATASFSAAASGAPAPSVQWEISTDGGNSWTSIGGANSASYSLSAQLSDNGYEYRAVFANVAGSATTNAATLSVASPVALPTVTTQPESQNAVAGVAVTLTATASGAPAPTVQWQVSTNAGASWTQIGGATTTSYTFVPAIGDNGNEYEAVFTNSAGTTASSAATIAVFPPSAEVAPSVTTEPADQAVLAGHNVLFTAAASGTPTPSVQWQVSSNGGGTWSNVAGATSASLSFAALQSQSGWEYEAVFTNAAGSMTTSAATLTVQSAPVITQSPSNLTVPLGTTASFSATASGAPAPTVQWQLSTDGGNTWSNITGATTTTYSFTAALNQSGNAYRAVFSNVVGSATSLAATLTVGPSATAPVITGQPSGRAVLNGTDVNFSASASGSPTPTVQWIVSMDGGGSWSDVANGTSTTLSFSASGAENGFEYEAVFTNAAGSATTNAVTLVVGADTASSNWSGYAASGVAGGFTSVSGQWTVPSVTCTSATTYSSEWIGIDGLTSTTVEQDGTEADCMSSTPTYDAWYEMYGDKASVNAGAEVPLSTGVYPVAPGNAMSATVSYNGSQWLLAISDLSENWSFSVDVAEPSGQSPTPAQSSAEWIVERPEICPPCSYASLSNFGTTSFSNSSATMDGQSGSISAVGGSALEMATSSTLLALPGALTGGGTGFRDSFYASS